jgi:hypothetical protein
MTDQNASAGISPAPATAIPAVPEPVHRPAELAVAARCAVPGGCRAADHYLALLSADPLAVTWWLLLLAIAPAPLAAAAFAPARLNLLAAVAGVLVLIAGIANEIVHIGAVLPPGPGTAGRRHREALVRAVLT